MKDGYWINYETGIVAQVDEHETWLRRGNNSDIMNVSLPTQNAFSEFEAIIDRNKFLLFVMANSKLMRVRGHGVEFTFEFSEDDIKKPFAAIYLFCVDFAGYRTNLVINNFDVNSQNTININWKQFKEAHENDDRLTIKNYAMPLQILPAFENYLIKIPEKLVN